MPESAAAPQPGETSAKSPLDKPLHLLTEDDIAQVTREDCRRFLKEKGMRRPSWNKSQAIQQVIMLKTLLETTPDCGEAGGSRKRLRISVPDNDCDNSLPESVPSEMRCETLNLVPEIARPPYQREDLDGPDSSSGGFCGHFAAARTIEPAQAQPRNAGATNIRGGQMAIFYCGQVNVYEDVPPDKAQEILHIAATPLDIPQERPVDGTVILQPVSRISNAACTRDGPGPAVIWPPFQAAKKTDGFRVCPEERNILRETTPVECPSPSTREALVQRYLEKRKDRFKSMRK